MKVKQYIIRAINNSQSRLRIALLVGTGEQNVTLAIKRNASNGLLTKMLFLKAIETETGIPIDEILEVETLAVQD